MHPKKMLRADKRQRLLPFCIGRHMTTLTAEQSNAEQCAAANKEPATVTVSMLTATATASSSS